MFTQLFWFLVHPATFYSATDTALTGEHNMSTRCCGYTTKTVVSLDLDLYEKCYLLVRTNNALKNKFILCLSELNVVFAYVRAFGAFVNSSGLQIAWQVAKWLDSSAVARNILDCKYMKRAVATPEQSALLIQFLLVKDLTDSGDLYALEYIRNCIVTATCFRKSCWISKVI